MALTDCGTTCSCLLPWENILPNQSNLKKEEAILVHGWSESRQSMMVGWDYAMRAKWLLTLCFYAEHKEWWKLGRNMLSPHAFSLLVCFSTWDSKSHDAFIQSGSSSKLTCLERPSQKCLEMCQASNSSPVKLTNEGEPLHSFNSECPNLKNDYKDCTNWSLVLKNSKRNKVIETVNTVLTHKP